MLIPRQQQVLMFVHQNHSKYDLNHRSSQSLTMWVSHAHPHTAAGVCVST